MDSKRRNRRSSTPLSGGQKAPDSTDQGNLWSEPSLPAHEAPRTIGKGADRKAIQDLLFTEGLLAARLAQDADTVETLQGQLIAQLPQNSLETRSRYAQSILRWFFPEGLSSLLPRVATAYRDEAITSDILRVSYLMVEPIVGACVADCLFPLEVGMRVPGDYFDRFLKQRLGEDPPANTRKRLKSNLMRLGFLDRSKPGADQLLPVTPTQTATILLLHHLFARDAPRTVELRHLFAHPFWKYLGYKSHNAVRHVLRAADLAGLLGKYVVADQLEQITTCYTLDELLERRDRL
jgi:hypothetical protein